MDSSDQEEWVKVEKLEQKLRELREQRIKVDEANETLRKKLETLSAHLDSIDVKYGKKETLNAEKQVSADVNENTDSTTSAPHVTAAPEKSPPKTD